MSTLRRDHSYIHAVILPGSEVAFTVLCFFHQSQSGAKYARNTHATALPANYYALFLHRFEAAVAESLRIWLHAAVTPLSKVLPSANFCVFITILVLQKT